MSGSNYVFSKKKYRTEIGGFVLSSSLASIWLDCHNPVLRLLQYKKGKEKMSVLAIASFFNFFIFSSLNNTFNNINTVLYIRVIQLLLLFFV